MSRPLVIWKAVLVTATFVVGGSVLGDAVGAEAAGIALLIVGGLNAGTDYYTSQTQVSRSEAVPKSEVVARQTDPSGPVVATPAAEATYGIPAGHVVDVAPTSWETRTTGDTPPT